MFADWNKFSMGPQGGQDLKLSSELRGGRFSTGVEAALGGQSNQHLQRADQEARTKQMFLGHKTRTHTRGSNWIKELSPLKQRKRFLKEREGCITANRN